MCLRAGGVRRGRVDRRLYTGFTVRNTVRVVNQMCSVCMIQHTARDCPRQGHVLRSWIQPRVRLHSQLALPVTLSQHCSCKHAPLGDSSRETLLSMVMPAMCQAAVSHAHYWSTGPVCRSSFSAA